MSEGFGGFLGGLAQAALKPSQGDVSKTGGAELNAPHHSAQSSAGPSFNESEVIKTAEQHGSGEGSLFATALSFLSDNKDKENEPLDEDDVTKAHDKVYTKGDTSGLSANALGGAAALQVLKQFTSESSSTSAGGSSQSHLISLAMAEATKLFDKSGGSASGNKQDAVNGAAMTVAKLVFQSGGTTEGKSSGGIGGLLNLAQNFTT